MAEELSDSTALCHCIQGQAVPAGSAGRRLDFYFLPETSFVASMFKDNSRLLLKWENMLADGTV